MTPARVRAVLTVVAAFIAAAIAGLIFGSVAVDVVLSAAVCWLLWNRAAIADRCDQATDDADNALGAVQQIQHHLDGTEPTTGRHARHDWGERAA